MKIESIIELWEQDAKIDKTNLDEVSLAIPILHNKYYKLYMAERTRMVALRGEFDKLLLDKKEHYVQGPNKRTTDLNWRYERKVLKTEADDWIDSDDDIIAFKLRIALQSEKIDYLKEIITQINNRSFHIKNAVDYLRWSHGG